VPGIVVAWLWLAPVDGNPTHPRLHALRQLLAGGAAMTAVGGAWPLLVELTPAASRPWISGTSDNTVLSLIFEYNGVGRVDGQAGGPGALGGGSVFGGQAGPLRLLDASLGGQAGWLLGFAAVAALGLLVSTRLRRGDARSGWLLAVGGSFLTTAVLFSFASGIFHPYYVSLLAPFVAALFGAGAAQMISSRARLLGALAVAAGVATELVVLGDYVGQLSWLPALLIGGGALAALALLLCAGRAARLAAVTAIAALLLLAPGVWAFETLSHATNGTFPEGGPADVQIAGASGRFGGPGGAGGPMRRLFGGGGGGAGWGGAVGSGGAGVPLFGGGGGGTAQPAGGFPGFGGRFGGAGGAGGGPGGFGSGVDAQVLDYVRAHGGGTIAVASQSSAAQSIIADGAQVAGIGGFSGRESDVSVSWLAQEVREGRIRWVLGEGASGAGGFAAGFGGDGRQGSRVAISAAEKACRRVTLESSSEEEDGLLGGGSSSTVLYDCRGRAAALSSAGA